MTNYQSYEEAIKAGAKGTDTITEPCDRCFGNGDIGYGKVEVYDVRVGAGMAQTCWKCFGRKTQTVRVSSVKARIRRAEKRAEKLAQEQAEAEAAKIARAEWNATHPAEVALINELADHKREQGLAFELWNNLTTIPTDAQIAKLREIKAQREEREAARRPVLTGKQIITGQIISIKDHESHYGYSRQITTKMVVKDDRGFKVWGTMPQALIDAVYDAWFDSLDDPERWRDFGPGVWRQWAKDQGVRVTFTATVEPAEGDDSFDFGFFKRPTKPALA